MNNGDLLNDRFEIQERVGAGGMGEVFRAQDSASGEAVAIKVLRSPQGHLAARFAREVELLAALSHPNIVRYIAHGETPTGEPFLAMEWLSGEDLKRRLERAPLTMDQTVALVTRVAEALGAAHARGVVHRDLKPSNLFLPGGHIEQVKVLDFGVARLEGGTRLTQTGAVLGTPGYMAPEQAESSRTVDARADVFTLGCLLFLCLTGTRAFDSDDVAGVVEQILFEEVPNVSDLRPEVPANLSLLVAQMLSKDPAQRPSDGAKVAAALSQLGPLARGSLAPPPLGNVSPMITGSERRLLSVVLLGAVGPAEGAPDEQAIDQVIAPYGGRISTRADGSVVVILPAEKRVATDQALQTARCALALRALAPRRPMALSMGWMELSGKLPEGDTMDRAARKLVARTEIPDGAQPIAIDEVIAGLLDARFDVIESTTGHLLHGERELGPMARTLLGKPTAYVGRDWEMGALEGMLTACIEESSARSVLITAPAGMGKSRLSAEFITRVRRRPMKIAIWIGRSDSLRAGSTLDLLRQALRGGLGIQEGEPLETRRDKLRARVAEHTQRSDRKRVTEFLGELVGTPFPDGDSVQLRVARQDAQLMSEQMRAAWVEFLRAETGAHPVLLVLEDLHWGDLSTVRFIDAALRDVSERPWMVFSLARPEVHQIFPALWAARRNAQEIRLKELTRRASERLVRQVLGDRVGVDTMERLIKQAAGNAFYLEELIRAVAEGKGAAMPETVLAMVEARLSRLDDEARRVLRAASVFGEVFWKSAVSSLLGGMMRTTSVGERLARLVKQEVLVLRAESRFSGEREFAFRHALLREGAYAMLTEEDRRLGHLTAGEWLEQHGEADPMVLAGHFERGGERARAGGFYLRAAEQAMRSGEVTVGADRARLGLACGGPPELQVSLLGTLCAALMFNPQTMGTTMTYAEEVMRLSPRGSIPWAQGALAKLGATFMAGRIDEFLATIKALQETEPTPEAAGTLALAVCAGSLILDILGRVQDGTALMAWLAGLVESLGGREPLVTLWWNAAAMTRDAYANEDPWSALACANANVALAEGLNHALHVHGSRMWQGVNQWFLGAYGEAERILSGLSFVDAGLSMSGSFRRFSLAWLRADRGALDDALLTATDLRDFGHEHHLPLDEGRGAWVLAEVRRREGDMEGAEREIQAALALLGTVSPLDHPGALGTLSRLRLSQGRAAEALAAAEESLSRQQAMGGACGVFRGAFVRLAHAEALHATSAIEPARAAITEARARIYAIAEKIADPEYRKSFLESVPENARTLALAREWLGDNDDRPRRGFGGEAPIVDQLT